MKKVFIAHGFEGSPSGGWQPWLMAELEKRGVHACALAISNPNNPICTEWVKKLRDTLKATQKTRSVW